MLLKSREIPALRGGIYDRNNFPLAVSVNQYNLFALRNFSSDDYLKLQSVILIKESYEVLAKLNRKNLIFSNLDFAQFEQIKNLRLDTIEIESFQKRYYPLGEQIAPLIGLLVGMLKVWRVWKIL